MVKAKILLIVNLLFLTSCSSTNTISDPSAINIEENTKVDWLITNMDSIIDFRKNEIGFATINGNTLVFKVSKDSIKTYNLTNLKTIHTFEEAPVSIIILSSVIVSLIVLGYTFSGLSM